MDVLQSRPLKYPNSTEDLATYLPLEPACVFYVREKEVFKFFFIWSSVCILPASKKKKKNCRIYSTDWRAPPGAQSA